MLFTTWQTCYSPRNMAAIVQALEANDNATLAAIAAASALSHQTVADALLAAGAAGPEVRTVPNP
eukprot:9192697-Pyramimonas_sp.AAC.1